MEGNGAVTRPDMSLIESFDAALKVPIEQLEKAHVQLTRAVKQFSRGFRDGNVRDVRSLAAAVTDRLTRLGDSLAACQESLQRYELTPASVEAYIRDFEDACRAEKISLVGNFPDYEVFPFEVRFNLDEKVALVNNHTVPLLRPSVLADHIRQVRDRLHGEAFNARRFRRALLGAYDVLARQHGRPLGGASIRANGASLSDPGAGGDGDRARSAAPGEPISLRLIHYLLSLREGSGQSGYSLKQFAFDIYRVRREGLLEGGRRLVFIHGRSSRNAVVVPVGGGETENLVALQVQEGS